MTMMNNPLESFIATTQAQINAQLRRQLPPASQPPCDLHQAMRYATLNGGKRLRPILLYATGDAFGAHREQLHAAACAIEFIHAYSMIHDDLPAMDNSNFRRGQPTCHKVFGAATAILAGDALQTLALKQLSQQPFLSHSAQLQMIHTLSDAALQMAAGQAEEMSDPVSRLEAIYLGKTAALFRASVQLGAIAARCTAAQREHLDQFARCVGLAFQIKDDLLDWEEDQASGKITFVHVHGIDAATQKTTALYDEALTHLNIACTDVADSTLLESIANFMIIRTY